MYDAQEAADKVVHVALALCGTFSITGKRLPFDIAMTIAQYIVNEHQPWLRCAGCDKPVLLQRNVHPLLKNVATRWGISKRWLVTDRGESVYLKPLPRHFDAQHCQHLYDTADDSEWSEPVILSATPETIVVDDMWWAPNRTQTLVQVQWYKMTGDRATCQQCFFGLRRMRQCFTRLRHP